MASPSPGGHASTPPAPPPKPTLGLEADGRRRRTTPPPGTSDGLGDVAAALKPLPRSDPGPDPGDDWLPGLVQNYSKQEIASLLASPALLEALTQARQSIHPTLQTSHNQLKEALEENANLAAQLSALSDRLSHQRSSTQAQLLSTHALERQWRQKEADMDRALAPFSPASLYQRLGQGIQEQAAICQAMEESFLQGEAGGGPASEREVAEWMRKYREAKVQLYLRQERKERWDEGRVGGWR